MLRLPAQLAVLPARPRWERAALPASRAAGSTETPWAPVFSLPDAACRGSACKLSAVRQEAATDARQRGVHDARRRSRREGLGAAGGCHSCREVG